MFETDVTYNPVLLQTQHWTEAARRLGDLSSLASEQTWRSLEDYLHLALRERLAASAKRLVQQGEQLVHLVMTNDAPERFRPQLAQLRSQYMRVETMMDFFANALASRTDQETIALLRACDRMAISAMRSLLDPLGFRIPPVLAYLDDGLGMALLKADMRLWDGHTDNPVAAIKVTRHNLMRPTALVHEAGHQVAHILNWNEELRTALRTDLRGYGTELADTWASWASEIAADAYGFVHTGFASVAALHDVVDTPGAVFAFSPGDPHPISYLRVLFGIQCCRHFYDSGLWDEMEEDWVRRHPVAEAPEEVHGLMRRSLEAMPEVVRIVCEKPYTALRNKSLAAWIDPRTAHPDRLKREADTSGKGFYRSPYLVAEAPLLRLALNGYELVERPGRASELLAQQRGWMVLLGNVIQ
ncbi:MAG: hypothetical protein SFV52_13345 [Saprospiraceae bacterium]|nr:hypothetical protein [Saprospiraceae bacterium]